MVGARRRACRPRIPSLVLQGEERKLIEPWNSPFGLPPGRDYLHWQAEDQKALERLNALIKECIEPFRGTGKP